MEFRRCIELLHRSGDLVDITASVSPRLEMAAIVNRVVAESQLSPALLFHAVSKSSFPCVANLFGTSDRISKILSAVDGVDISTRMAQLDSTIESFESFMDWLSIKEDFKPKRVCPPEMIRHEDFSALPEIVVWPQDAGHYLSFAVIISQTMQGKRVNCGIYRVQLHGSHRATVHFRPGSDGQKIFAEYQKNNEQMPIAIVLGCDPALMFAAVFPLGNQTSEFCFASYIRQQPIPYYTSELNTLPIPTQSEIVIQGSLDPTMTLPEGPFGNHEGSYCDVVQCPVFTLERIESRSNALMPVTMVGGPPTENMVLGSYIAELIVPLVKRQIPQVLKVYIPPETVFHGCAFVQLSVDEQIADVKKQVQSHPLFVRSKLLVFVDDLLDIDQPQQLYWRVMNHYLHNGNKMNLDNSKRIVIDTIGCSEKKLRLLQPNPEIEKKVSIRWHEFGLNSIVENRGS